jgi:molybdate/tungstate transport system permease protein
MSRLSQPLVRLAMLALTALLLAPALVLLITGVRGASQLPAPALTYTTTSLASSALALAIIVAAGTPLAWWLARRGSRTAVLVQLVLSVPLLLPPLVIGLVLEYLIGFSGVTGLGWTNTFAGLVTAEVYEAAPYYVFAAWSAFLTLPRDQWESALSLGWTPSRSFVKVGLPLAAPGLAAGAAMAWSRAIGAFGAPIIVSYHPSGLPVGLWITLEEVGLPAALPLALLLVLIALPVPLLVASWASHAHD